MEWHEIFPHDIPESDGVRKCRIAGKSLCIIRQGDALHVTASRCPHAGADLSGGWCENGQLVCPRHRHTFDLSTGKGAPGQANYIHVYPTRQTDGAWFVGIAKGWLQKLLG